MPDLAIAVETIDALPHAAVPTLAARLRLTNAKPAEAIQHIALQTNIQIEPRSRSYTPAEQARLRDLFGEPSRWGDTLKTLIWTQVHLIVPPFHESTAIDLPLPCSFDFNIAATKYFAGVEQGSVPLRFLFSGTMFYGSPKGELQIAQIPWTCEARAELSVATWRRMMELYYPGTAWLCLRNDVFARLYDYKVRRGLPTWEHAMSEILDQVQA